MLSYWPGHERDIREAVEGLITSNLKRPLRDSWPLFENKLRSFVEENPGFGLKLDVSTHFYFIHFKTSSTNRHRFHCELS